MPKQEPTVGNGLVALLGEPVAHLSPEVLPEPKVTIDPEIRLRQQMQRNQAETAEIERFREALEKFKQPAMDPDLVLAALKSSKELLDAARKLSKDAEANYKARQAEYDELEARAKALDTKTETERNQEYLASQMAQRFQAAKEKQERYERALSMGLLSPEELDKLAPTSSALDRSIAERNQKMRQQNNVAALKRH